MPGRFSGQFVALAPRLRETLRRDIAAIDTAMALGYGWMALGGGGGVLCEDR